MNSAVSKDRDSNNTSITAVIIKQIDDNDLIEIIWHGHFIDALKFQFKIKRQNELYNFRIINIFYLKATYLFSSQILHFHCCQFKMLLINMNTCIFYNKKNLLHSDLNSTTNLTNQLTL